jgi:hypothetical protein
VRGHEFGGTDSPLGRPKPALQSRHMAREICGGNDTCAREGRRRLDAAEQGTRDERLRAAQPIQRTPLSPIFLSSQPTVAIQTQATHEQHRDQSTDAWPLSTEPDELVVLSTEFGALPPRTRQGLMAPLTQTGFKVRGCVLFLWPGALGSAGRRAVSGPQTGGGDVDIPRRAGA